MHGVPALAGRVSPIESDANNLWIMDGPECHRLEPELHILRGPKPVLGIRARSFLFSGLPRHSILVAADAWCLVLGVFLVLSFTSHAQPKIAGTINLKKFRVSPEFFDPPHEGQMKWLLQGEEAEPQPGGLVLIKGAQLQKFREHGSKELLIETPQCLFDQSDNSVRSAASLRYEAVDATGVRAVYTGSQGSLQMTGNPQWRSGQRQGGADELTVDRTNRNLIATGNAWVKLPGPGTNSSGFLPAARQTRPGSSTT